MNREIFIRNLKSARETRGLTQKAVADALGISDRTYSKWETGETEPGIDALCRLGEIYGIAIADLFSEETPPKEGSPIRREFAGLTPVQALLRTREMMDEAFDGQCDAAIELNKRLFGPEDTEAQRIWTEPLPAERAPEGLMNGFISRPDGFYLRHWDEEMNLRLLMLPAKAGLAPPAEEDGAISELFSLLERFRLLLPMMEAETAREWQSHFSAEYLAKQAKLTPGEAEETLKAMEYWGFCTHRDAETGTGAHRLYLCGDTRLLRAILALARLLAQDMQERRDAMAKRGDQA